MSTGEGKQYKKKKILYRRQRRRYNEYYFNKINRYYIVDIVDGIMSIILIK